MRIIYDRDELEATFEEYEDLLAITSNIDHYVRWHIDLDIEDIEQHYKKYGMSKEEAKNKVERLKIAKQKMEESLYWLNSAINEKTKAFTVGEYTTEFDEYQYRKYNREEIK